MNLLIVERRQAVKRLESYGFNVSRRLNLDGLCKNICRAKGEPMPPHRDGKIRLVQRFIGKEAVPELAPFAPLKQSRAMLIAQERVHELYGRPGLTDRLRK